MIVKQKALNILKSISFLASKNALLLEDDEERLKNSVLYPEWQIGNHVVGEIYNSEGQTWECFQSYDNAVYPDITPENEAWFTFNRPLHGKSPETARTFVKPMGAHDIYHIDEYVIWTDSEIYCCLQDTPYSPNEYKQAWQIVE